MENSGGSGVGPVMAAYCLETSLGLGPEARCTPIGRMLPDLRVKLPRDRDKVDERVLLSEGRVPSPLSRAEVGLGDLGHVGDNFGASWDLGTRGNANFIFQREFSTSAMLLFEVAYPHLKLHVSLFPPLSIIPLWSSLRRARSAVFILRGCVNAISRHALKFLSYRSMVPFRDARLFAKSIRPTNGRGERKRERKRSDVPPPPPRFHGISRRILVGSALFGKVEYFLLSESNSFSILHASTSITFVSAIVFIVLRGKEKKIKLKRRGLLQQI